MNKNLKLAGLNIGIAIVNIILFSPGFIGIGMDGSDALGTAIGGTVIFLSLAVFIYGNARLLLQKGPALRIKDINNLEDCIPALKQATVKRTFDGSLTAMLEQVEQLRKMKSKIRDFLAQKINIIDSRFDKFNETVQDVEYVFYTNIKGALNKIIAFDEEEYEKINSGSVRGRSSSKYTVSKLSIYDEYMSFVKNAVNVNDEILLKLDALLLEISGMDSMDAGGIGNMKEIKELDNLIATSRQQ